MKKSMALLLILSTLCFATQYSAMSTEKLMSLRGTVPVEDIEVFGNELTKRVQAMNEEELRKYGIWQMLQRDKTQAIGTGCNCGNLNQRVQQ